MYASIKDRLIGAGGTLLITVVTAANGLWISAHALLS
jgi:hypothetical protein